jgi:hypothetical protein
MGYSAKVILDSVSPAGVRLTTAEVTFPRIVLAEFNTHRMLSRNSASSRAIPVEKRIAMVEADPFRWATAKVQTRNRSNNRRIEIDGTVRILSEWAEISGVSRTCIAQRIARGIVGKELFEPPRGIFPRTMQIARPA